MTYFYTTKSWTSQPQITEEQIEFWKHLAEKKNWRIVQLPNGFYQTEYKDIDCPCDPEKDECCEKWNDVTRRETIEGAEAAILRGLQEEEVAAARADDREFIFYI